MVSHFGFNLHLSSDVEHFFHVSVGPLISSLEKSVQVLCPFFNWVACLPVWSHVISLYILEIKPLSEVSLANMFSHTVGSLLILLIFLAVQKLFGLM